MVTFIKVFISVLILSVIFIPVGFSLYKQRDKRWECTGNPPKCTQTECTVDSPTCFSTQDKCISDCKTPTKLKNWECTGGNPPKCTQTECTVDSPTCFSTQDKCISDCKTPTKLKNWECTGGNPPKCTQTECTVDSPTCFSTQGKCISDCKTPTKLKNWECTGGNPPKCTQTECTVDSPTCFSTQGKCISDCGSGCGSCSNGFCHGKTCYGINQIEIASPPCDDLGSKFWNAWDPATGCLLKSWPKIYPNTGQYSPVFLDPATRQPCKQSQANECKWYWPDGAVCSNSGWYTKGTKETCDPPVPPAPLPKNNALYKARFHPLSVVDSDGRDLWINYWKNGTSFGLKIDWLDESRNKPVLMVNGSSVEWLYSNRIASVQSKWGEVLYCFAYVSVPFGKDVSVKFDNLKATVYIPEKASKNSKSGFVHVGDPCPTSFSSCKQAFTWLNNSFNEVKDQVALLTIGGDNAYSSSDPVRLLTWLKGKDTEGNTQVDPKFHQILMLSVLGNHDYCTGSMSAKSGTCPTNFYPNSADNDGACGVYQMLGIDSLTQPLLTGEISTSKPCIADQIMDVENTLGFYAVGRYGFVTWDNMVCLDSLEVLTQHFYDAAARFKVLGIDTLFVISHWNHTGEGAQNTTQQVFTKIKDFFPDIETKKYITNHQHINTHQAPSGYLSGGGGWIGNTGQPCLQNGASYTFFDATKDLVNESNPRMNFGIGHQQQPQQQPQQVFSMSQEEMNDPEFLVRKFGNPVAGSCSGHLPQVFSDGTCTTGSLPFSADAPGACKIVENYVKAFQPNEENLPNCESMKINGYKTDHCW